MKAALNRTDNADVTNAAGFLSMRNLLVDASDGFKFLSRN